ncbi:MAG: hypothetical protein KatS3mg111_0545 [Pirellulaceae bacterium]|nr:MAG: hypothetical protein KatS3mg111_0545 [Pirellulaceae bacterium]
MMVITRICNRVSPRGRATGRPIHGAVLVGAMAGMLWWGGQHASSQEAMAYTYPLIQEYGPVVRLPNAAQQPRDGSRIVVDLTRGGEPSQLNSAIEKVARFVNIYAGAGDKPAAAQIVVVLHGNATLVSLRDNAYEEEFGVATNPHLPLIRQLREAGVKFLVCGQSLAGYGRKPTEVDPVVELAVSALTALVNLQSDGFAYVPLQ